jgi:hypothetical protein
MELTAYVCILGGRDHDQRRRQRLLFEYLQQTVEGLTPSLGRDYDCGPGSCVHGSLWELHSFILDPLIAAKFCSSQHDIGYAQFLQLFPGIPYRLPAVHGQRNHVENPAGGLVGGRRILARDQVAVRDDVRFSVGGATV